MQIALPDRHFYWRIRSNALTFAFQHEELRQTDFDLVLATSMVDLCNLRGLLPHLASVPSVLYFHENQFAYPTREPNSNLINAQLTSVYSGLCASKLVFNSRYNQDTYLSGAENLLKKMPDGTSKDLLNHLPACSTVIPVPVQSRRSPARTIASGNPIEIVWNHRWEYDKQPEVFFNALTKLIDKGVDIRVHVMGQAFREVPDCFENFKSSCLASIATWGYQSPDDYQRILQSAHIVVSAALHDFQGLGMLEAIQAGCTPIAPNRMAYPEYIPGELLYEVNDNRDVSFESEQLYRKMLAVLESTSAIEIDVNRYHSSQVLPEYERLLLQLIK